MTPTDRFAEKIAEAQQILEALGLPIGKQTLRRRERWALALLALANVKPMDSWVSSQYWSGPGSWALRAREVLEFWNEHYDRKLKDSSYDDVRDEDLRYLVEARVALGAAGKPNASLNDSTRRFALSPDAHEAVAVFGTTAFADRAERFVRVHGALSERLDRVRETRRVVATLPDGSGLQLSQGKHNELQAAIVQEFLPVFVDGAEILYLGDSVNRLLLVNDTERLKDLGLTDLTRAKIPDVIVFDAKRGWLLLVEAVASSGEINQIRHLELARLTQPCKVPVVFVSAFLTKRDFQRFAARISWETEVWIAESPGHMVHFNGERFLGPYERK